MKEGRVLSAFASSIALPIASKSLPSSTVIVWKPNASIRLFTSSVNAKSVLPSIVILLLSYKTINLLKPNVPAKENASEEIPSIMQPSPPNT